MSSTLTTTFHKKFVVIANFQSGKANGAFKYIENLSIYLNEEGYKCELWGMSSEKDINNYEFYRHFKVDIRNPFIPKSLKHAILEEKDSIVSINLHSIFTPINISLSKFVKKLSIPLSLTPHGAYHSFMFERRGLLKKLFFNIFEKQHLQRIDYFYIHGGQEEQFLKRYTDKPLILILSGFPSTKVYSRPVNYENQGCDNILKLLFIGRMDPLHKGLDLLLQALGKINSKSISLTLVGPKHNPKSQEIINKLIEVNNLNENVSILDPVYAESEKINLYLTHDIFVHTSRWEGMPNSVLEAMYYGMPVMVSENTNMKQIIESNKCGYVLPDLSISGIASLIALIHINKNKLQEYSVNCSNLVPDLFNWNKLARQYITDTFTILGKRF